MPSKDPVNPEVNKWLRSAQAKPHATEQAARGATDSRTGQREVSGQVLRLAKRLGADPDALAKKIPPDTLRRTKYPVLESVTEDGKRSFKHDRGITEARTPLQHT